MQFRYAVLGNRIRNTVTEIDKVEKLCNLTANVTYAAAEMKHCCYG